MYMEREREGEREREEGQNKVEKTLESPKCTNAQTPD